MSNVICGVKVKMDHKKDIVRNCQGCDFLGPYEDYELHDCADYNPELRANLNRLNALFLVWGTIARLSKLL